MSKRNNIDQYLQEPESEIPEEEFQRLNREEQESIQHHRALDGALQRSMNELSHHGLSSLYSEEDFSKMLLNRLEGEGLPGTKPASGTSRAGFLGSIQTFFNSGLPLYAGGGLAAAAAVVLIFLFYGPSSDIQQPAEKTTGTDAAESSSPEQGRDAAAESEEASDDPGMMAQAEEPSESGQTDPRAGQERPADGPSQVAVGPRAQTRDVPRNVASGSPNQAGPDQESGAESTEGKTDAPDGNKNEERDIASNMPDPETSVPVEGSEELSEEVRRGLMNERYSASFSKEMQLKRRVKNADSPEKKKEAMQLLLDYYEEKGQTEKAEEVRKEMAELK